MKKKLLSTILVGVMALSLIACGNSPGEEDSTQNDTEAIEEVSKKETEKEISHDFNPETNQQETFYTLAYQIPSAWERKELNDDSKLYYYPEDGMLMLTFHSGTLDYTNDGYDEYVESLKEGFGDYVELDRYSTTVLDDLPALNLTFTGVASDIPLTAYNVVFSTDQYTYTFTYADYDVSNYDRSKDFEEIIKSITYADEILNTEESDNSTDSSYTPPELTTGQSNALGAARDYLDTMAFSYTGLIEQLEYEGYSTEDATYAADNCGADWNEQAAKAAENYLDVMSFSRQGLIDQLIYEGFTQEQAEYGVTSVGY